MNVDLENELKENPDLVTVVARLRNSAELGSPAVGAVGGRHSPPAVRCVWKPVAVLAAASLLVVLAFSVWFVRSEPQTPSPGSITAYGAREYRQTPAEMIASQNADGSWQNDFLTRRNADVLRSCVEPGAQIAYKKAMRNLRSRGIL